VIATLQVIGGLAAAAFIFRRWPRTTFAIAWLAYLVLAGLRGSRGKIMHNDVLLLLASVPFLAAPLDIDRRDQRPSRRTGWPIRGGIAVIALAYFFAGYWKLTRAGLSWITTNNVRLAIAWGPNPSVPRWDWLANIVTRYAWAGHLIAAVTIAFEISIPLVLFFPRLRVGYAIVSSILHVSTYFLLGLDYWAWIGVVWLFFVDWPAVIARVTATNHRPFGLRPVKNAGKVSKPKWSVPRITPTGERNERAEQQCARWKRAHGTVGRAPREPALT
jgi:hypothetical protein